MNREDYFEQKVISILHNFSGALKQAVCRHKRVDIIFNDLDRDWCFTNKICDKPQEPKVCDNNIFWL